MDAVGIWPKWKPKKILRENQQWVQRPFEKEWLWIGYRKELQTLIDLPEPNPNPLTYSASLYALSWWMSAVAASLNVPGQEAEAWQAHRQANGYWTSALKIHLASCNGFTLSSEWMPLLRVLVLGQQDLALSWVRLAREQKLDERHVYHDFWSAKTRYFKLVQRFALHLIYALDGQRYLGDQLNEEPLGPFAALIEVIRHPDPAQLVEPIIGVLDWHTWECDDRRKEGYAEFCLSSFKLCPLEILALYRVREALGLANPAQIDHPLMQLPLSRLPDVQPLYQDDLTRGAERQVSRLLPHMPAGFWSF